jgi:hypothetical protein
MYAGLRRRRGGGWVIHQSRVSMPCIKGVYGRVVPCHYAYDVLSVPKHDRKNAMHMGTVYLLLRVMHERGTRGNPRPARVGALSTTCMHA